jgi:hypothetical protein
MTLYFRRKPLALIVCCTFSGTLSAGLAGAVQAGEILRVDPRLLGIPAEPVTATSAAFNFLLGAFS